MKKTPPFIKHLRGELKKSRAKIWIRAFLLIIFSVIFSIYFSHDIAAGYFSWREVTLIILFFIPIGFLISQLVPMQVDFEKRVVTLSLDKVYFILIWVLVIAKLIASYAFHAVAFSDVIMCIILGLMSGRLGGIGLRVRKLKREHGFLRS